MRMVCPVRRLVLGGAILMGVGSVQAEPWLGAYTAADSFGYTALPRVAQGKPKVISAILATGTP